VQPIYHNDPPENQSNTSNSNKRTVKQLANKNFDYTLKPSFLQIFNIQQNCPQQQQQKKSVKSHKHKAASPVSVKRNK